MKPWEFAMWCVAVWIGWQCFCSMILRTVELWDEVSW